MLLTICNTGHCGNLENCKRYCLAGGAMSWFNHLESNSVLSENLEHLYTLEPTNATPGYRHSCVFILVCVHRDIMEALLILRNKQSRKPEGHLTGGMETNNSSHDTIIAVTRKEPQLHTVAEANLSHYTQWRRLGYGGATSRMTPLW